MNSPGNGDSAGFFLAVAPINGQTSGAADPGAIKEPSSPSAVRSENNEPVTLSKTIDDDLLDMDDIHDFTKKILGKIKGTLSDHSNENSINLKSFKDHVASLNIAVKNLKENLSALAKIPALLHYEEELVQLELILDALIMSDDSEADEKIKELIEKTDSLFSEISSIRSMPSYMQAIKLVPLAIKVRSLGEYLDDLVKKIDISLLPKTSEDGSGSMSEDSKLKRVNKKTARHSPIKFPKSITSKSYKWTPLRKRVQ